MKAPRPYLRSAVRLLAVATLSLPFAPSAQAAGAPIRLDVDLRDTDHRVFRVRETLPVAPGELTLRYPSWLPGNHAPRGPIDSLTGLQVMAGGQKLAWARDPLDVYSFRVQVPEGVSSLDLSFEFVSPTMSEQGRIVSTPEIIGLQWNTVVLAPAQPAHDVIVEAGITLPAGWQSASALEVQQREGDSIRFAPQPLDTLIDSPLFAGKHFRRVILDEHGPVALNIVADAPWLLDAKPEQLAAHVKLVRESDALFRSRHFDHYDFLLALSEHFGGIGLEHHRSSENGTVHNYFSEWDKTATVRSLLAHEYTHSWDGKFRRPAGQLVPDFNTPLENSLLWVYEGQTQYWGQVLSARSGLWTPELARDSLATIAATLDLNRPGRIWRPLVDTTYQPIMNARRPLSWVSWQRTEDYYNEGLLIWLDVDTKLRELSRGKKSLDDFAATFFGIDDGSYADSPYTLEDVAAFLNRVVPFDWLAFLKARIEGNGPGAPLDGLARSGWKLGFAAEPTAWIKGSEERGKYNDFAWSLGLSIAKDGKLNEVVWGSPAFAAGISRGDSLIAVNGIAYSADKLKQALRNAQTDRKPIELLLKNLDHYRTVKVEYYDGPRYPKLERIDGTPDRLSAIYKSRTK